MSKHYGDFYCLNCLHFFRTKSKKFEPYKKVYENKGYCNIIMSSGGTRKLEFNQY